MARYVIHHTAPVTVEVEIDGDNLEITQVTVEDDELSEPFDVTLDDYTTSLDEEVRAQVLATFKSTEADVEWPAWQFGY